MRSSPLIAAAALVASAALAQTGTIDSVDLSRGTNLPPTSAALADEATALSVNPAGLSGVDEAQFFYLHERAINRGQTADALYVAGSLGGFSLALSEDWIRSGGRIPDYRRTGFGFSLGGPTLSLGAGFHWFSSDSLFVDGLSSVDLGLLVRPCRGFSAGFSVLNVDQPDRFGITLPRNYDLAVAVRPFGERYSLAIDYLFGSDALAGRLQYTLQAELIRGLKLSAGVSHPTTGTESFALQAGLTVDLEHVGLTYAGGGTNAGLDHLVQVRGSLESYRALSLSGGKIALVDLDDRLAGSSLVSTLLGLGTSDPYLKLMRFLDEATRDGQLKAVVLKINGLPRVGLGRVEELRQAVFRLRASGKKVFAVLLTGEDPDYLLAIAADKVYALPESTLLINGLLANVTFLGGTMDKLSVHWDVARVGAYKNAPDQLTRSSMSAEQREATSAYLDTDVSHYENAVQQARHLTPEQFRATLAEGFVPPRRAKDLGLIDEVITPAELDERLDTLAPGLTFDPLYGTEDVRTNRWGTRKKIAIVPVLGNITGGKSRQDPLGGEAIAGAETVVKALQRAEADPRVVAIVVRVDSGGGDGLASDLMYRAVLEAKKKKPVVASMGDVAASGGYFASMGADTIFALPTTITGSIGVFVVKPALGELAGKLGITRETISRAPMAEMMGEWRAWTPEEQVAAQKWVDAFYDDFISEVAASRKLAKPEVDKIARGRVWSGADAKARGLVDQLGGLQEAIAEAKKRAGRSPGEDLEVEVLGEPHGFLAPLGGESGVGGRLLEALLPNLQPPQPLVDLGRSLGLEPWMFQDAKVMAALEYQLRIH